MARNKKRFSVLFFIILFTALSCSKSDTPLPTPAPSPAPVPDNSKDGGNMKRYEMVTISVSEVLSQESYIGSIGGREVTLVRLDEKNLGFMADQNVPLGAQKLIVPALKDFAYNFQISEPALSGTADESILPLLSAFNNVAQQNPENEEISKSLKSIVDIFEKASTEQKNIMAKTYLANKPFIDTIINRIALNGDIQSVARMSTLPNRTSNAFSLDRMGWMDNEHKVRLIAKHMTAILIMSVTGTGAAVIRPYGWHTVVLGGVSALAAVSARNAVLEIAALTFYYTAFSLGIGPEYFQTNIYTDRKLMNSFVSNKTTANTDGQQTLVFLSGEDQIIGAAVKARNLNQGDKTGSSQTIRDFFSKLVDLQNYFIKINDAIKWVNENIPYSNMKLLDVPDIGNESKVANVAVGLDALGKGLKLTIQHPNIKVNKLSMSSAGQLLVNLEVVNTQTRSVSTELKYEFTDAFSKFDGSIPIKVEKELSLEGKWIMVTDRNGNAAGQEVQVNNSLCANIPAVKFTITGEVVFAANTYSGSRKISNSNYSGALINPQTCELLEPGKFVTQTSNESFNGTYTIKEGKITEFKYFGIYYGTTMEFFLLDNNTISIDGNIYVRENK